MRMTVDLYALDLDGARVMIRDLRRALVDAEAENLALRRALRDVEILASDAQGAAFAAAQLSRMVRINDPVPASPPGGGGR